MTARQIKNWANRQAHLLANAPESEYIKVCETAPIDNVPTATLYEAWQGLTRFFPEAANVVAGIIVLRGGYEAEVIKTYRNGVTMIEAIWAESAKHSQHMATTEELQAVLTA